MPKITKIELECRFCGKITCTNDECINLTDDELIEVMGFSREDIMVIKQGEKG